MYLFDYIGGFYFWCYLATINRLRRKNIPTLKDVRTGKNMYAIGDIVDSGVYFLKLKFIGFVVTMFICYLLTKVRF
jgi:hypothetical protein